MTDFALLILRATVGSLLAGHGAQKLFGSFEGPGLEGTTGWLSSMGLRPGRPWAWLAGVSEFGGGLLTALGAFNPIGPLMVIGSMLMATAKVHAGKPIWVTQGGAELPITNMAAVTAVALARPGRFSVDGLLGIRLSRWLFVPGIIAIAAIVLAATAASEQELRQAEAAQPAEPPEPETRGEADDSASRIGGATVRPDADADESIDEVVPDAAIAATRPDGD